MHINNIISPLAYAAILAVSSALACASTTAEPSDDSSQFAGHYTPVINPEIPSSYTFCGQKIDLTPTDRWERFDRELTSVIYTHGNTLLTLKRANKYFPVMAPILRANGVPEDLMYLACVESYLNNRAYSPAKAAGVWQFLASTAKQYGLEVSDEVDERYNLEKATAAAARMLKSSYKRYGNWESAMAAYNGGPKRISDELADQGVSTAFDLYLTDETTRYTYRIMAMKAVMENPSLFGFKIGAHQLYQPEEFDVVQVSEPVESWPAWAKEHGITYSQLREANPWIRAKKLTNKAGTTYDVHVPKATSLKRQTKPKVFNPNWVK